MSTKTTFKRIALVAVAALGLGVLSVAPSSATVVGLTVTAADGQATVLTSDSTTAASLAISFTRTDATDSVSVTSYVSAKPAGATLPTQLKHQLTDSATATVETKIKANSTAFADVTWGSTVQADSQTVVYGAATPVNATVAAKLMVFFSDTTTVALKAGTYSITSIVTPYSAGVAVTAGIVTKTTNIVVSDVAANSKVASVAYSTLGDPSAASAVATVSTTAAAASTLLLTLKNASNNTTAAESVTATITGPGTIGDGTVNGKSVVLKYTSALTLNVYADGTAGVSTINVSTTSVAFSPKTVTFYAASPKTITAAVYNPVLNVGTNGQAVAATAVDSNGTNWAGQLYIVASSATDALVGGSATAPTPCKYDPTYKTHFCPITTIAAGTAKFKIVDQTLALGTETAYGAAMTAATSNEVSVTATAGVPTTVKLAFDKASYQPFEKAIITVTPLDSAGKTMGSKTVSNIFATGGISSNIAFGSQSDTLTGVTLTTSADSSSTAPRTAGSYTYVVYMPAQGTVTISATGGTGLAAAGQVAVTASANVVNSSVDAATDAANEATDAANAATDAALAAADAADAATAAAQDASDAVAALSATVATLVASLKAQITSLTNLVIKIQKKVKA